MNESKKKMSIRTKIFLGFGIISIIVFVMNIYTFKQQNNILKNTELIIDTELQLLNADQGLSSSFAVRLSSARGYVLSDNEAEKEIFERYTEKAKKYSKDLERLGASDEALELVKTSVQWRENVINNVFAVYEKGDKEKARTNLNSLTAEGNEIGEKFEKLAQNQFKAISESGQEVLDINNNMKITMIVCTVAIIIFAVIIAVFTANTIIRPIKRVTERISLMATGDISNEDLQVTSRDEAGELTVAANTLSNKLREMMQSVQDISTRVATSSEHLARASEEVSDGSTQISETMQELAKGTEDQANHATQLVEVTEGFTHQVELANDSGKKIAEKANEVQGLTKNGHTMMNSSASQMKTIDSIVKTSVEKVEMLEQQSQDITKLVSVIQSVAEQTNLLALNAAIEAARAGEEGKGFAVVADEVRKLAEQVALSVTDISVIVQTMQSHTSEVTNSLRTGYEEVSKGTNQIIETGKTFEEIAAAVSSVNTNAEDISNSLSEIMTNTQNINASIDQIASVSEQSAAGVEETTATIEEAGGSIDEMFNATLELSQMANQLNAEIRNFKITKSAE